jgi:hypothetical protein
MLPRPRAQSGTAREVEGMREQVSKCAVAKDKGNMADLMKVKEALPPLF